MNSSLGKPTRQRIRRDSFGRLIRLCMKELREILRDRRTIVTLVLMPLLVYPLLSLTFQRFLLSSQETDKQVQCIIGVENNYAMALIDYYMHHGNDLLQQLRTRDAQDTLSEKRPRIQLGYGLTSEPTLAMTVDANLHDALANDRIDLGLRLLPTDSVDLADPREEPIRCELLYYQNSVHGVLARDYIEKRLRAINEGYVNQRLQERGISSDLPAKFVRHELGGTNGMATSLGTLIPLILILMTITGAVYPAIDLTAGERERGTMEVLIAAPVPRLRLLFAKYVAVLTVAMLTATANLIAMMITLALSGLAGFVFGESGFSLTTIAQVFGLLILFAAFFSAVLLAITSFARSFKEAQAYLIPLMLISLAPGLFSMLPGLRFNGWLAITPLVNIVLLGRDMFQGVTDPALATIAIASTVFYALAALGLASRIFGTDAVLYGSPSSWSDLLQRPAEKRDAATVAGAIFCLAISFPLCFLAAGLLGRFRGMSMETQLGLSGVLTVLVFAGLPLLAAVIQRVRIRSAFQLHLAKPLSFLAAGLLGVSLWPFIVEIFILSQSVGLATLNEEQIKQVEQLLQRFQSVSPGLILICVAIAPAVCEELFFRGFLFSALRRAMSPSATVLTSALLFGLFHVVSKNVLTFERFLPSMIMGLVLGWVCLRTRSTFPGMLLHAIHNGVLLTMADYRETLIASGIGGEQRSHIPAVWLAVAALGILAGATLMFLSSRRH